MDFPDNLKYTKDHEWIRVEENGEELIAFVGITDFAQGELGDIVYLEIETVGQELEKEAVLGTIEAVKTVSDLFMPVTGKVLEVNSALENNPELINNDPYSKGWMSKITVSDKRQLDDLLSSAEYQKLVS